MVRWMCDIKVKDRVPSKELRERERLGLDDIISVLQQSRLHWYRHVLRKKDNDWVKKECSRPRGLGERSCKKNCHALKLNREDAMDCSSWRKLIKDGC